MKKIFSILILVIIMFGLKACTVKPIDQAIDFNIIYRCNEGWKFSYCNYLFDENNAGFFVTNVEKFNHLKEQVSFLNEQHADLLHNYGLIIMGVRVVARPNATTIVEVTNNNSFLVTLDDTRPNMLVPSVRVRFLLVIAIPIVRTTNNGIIIQGKKSQHRVNNGRRIQEPILIPLQ